MKNLKSLFIVALVMALFVMVFSAAPVFAETDHGDCGKGVNWSLDDEGTLTINGNGKVDDYRETMESSRRVINEN